MQIVYFPYLTLRRVDQIPFGKARVWNSGRLDKEIGNAQVRNRVAALLETHRLPAGDPTKSSPVTDMGVVSIGPSDFRPFGKAEMRAVEDLRCVLFLGCLSANTRLIGPNAGNCAFTSENFSLLVQDFDLSTPYFAERSGTLVQVTAMGYKIGQMRFPMPSYVPRPIYFSFDDDVLRALEMLRDFDRSLYRRILRASAVFIESYYNTSSLNVAARILLQVAAFEVLLNLPDREQRRAFKDSMERLCSNSRDRKFAYKYEVRSGKRRESRTQSGIWADRFYTLRNHIVHGEEVAAAEYLYRGTQHQVVIAPLFFIQCVRRLIAEATEGISQFPPSYDRILWHISQGGDGREEDRSGFRLERDWGRFIQHKLSGTGLFESGNISESEG